MADLLLAANKALEPGGLLIFTNPLRDSPSSPSLKLEYRQTVDLGGFDCQLEMYSKLAPRDGKISHAALLPNQRHDRPKRRR